MCPSPDSAEEQEVAYTLSPRRRRARRRSAPAVATPWPIPPIRSRNARRVAEWFGLPQAQAVQATSAVLPPQLRLPAGGRILLITGPSGSGKSHLMRRLLATAPPASVIDVANLALPPVPCVDQFGQSLPTALALLNRVGLGEARTYISLPAELSDGQRWRLRLAIAIHRAGAHHRRGRPVFLAADEFCAVLDRVTACVVARSLRRTISALATGETPMSAVVATSHDDLEPALLPDDVVRCDFGNPPSGTAK